MSPLRTQKRTELAEAFLARLDPELAGVCQQLILHLSQLGYHPKKQRENIVFLCPWHKKQLAKMGFDKAGRPFFGLRFSACRGYSPRFEKIVYDTVSAKGHREARCVTGSDDFCKGPPERRLYTCTLPNGETRRSCGAKALAIPDLCPADLPEIKALMEEEHRFLMEYEARAVSSQS